MSVLAGGDAIDQGVTAALARFRQIGGWVEYPEDLRPPLVGEVKADVVIAGGGFAGLSTALELAAVGAKVIVLEREFCGFGASGRNAGYLAGGQGVKFAMFLHRLGPERAKEIVGFFEAGVDYVEEKLAAYGIDCDYIASGHIRAAVHPSQEEALRKKMEIAIEFGAPGRYLDGSEMRARKIPSAFLSGSYSPRGGTLNPGKYVMGLRRAALEAGVQIFEHTSLLSYTDGATVECRTERGIARAPFLVLATNAYTPQLGLLKNLISPIRVSAIETERLSPEQLDMLGWPGREGIVTPHVTMESHRLTKHDTLVITTKRLDYIYGSATPNTPDNPAYRALVSTLHERYPSLTNLAVRSCWSGYISLSQDGLPVVGETGAHKNVLFTAGCNGHGVGTQSMMGRLLARRIGGVEDPMLTSLRHATPKVPPEPFRYLGLKSALRGARILDERVNRQIRRMKSG